MTQPLLQAADLRAAARLTTDAVAGLASLVEAVHARIASLPRLPVDGGHQHGDRTRGVTGLAYASVRGVTRMVGGSAEAMLGWLESALRTSDPRLPPHAEREFVVAALNGVLGDHLAATDNPLAITMSFRQQGRALVLDRPAMRAGMPGATPRVLVLLHGLCMGDLQWRRAGHDHGAELARAAGFTPVYLNYNSGLCISTNGRILAQQMERLLDAWPVPVERMVLLGHSMGGLVARSAIHHAPQIARGRLRWPAFVSDLVCLGSPHLGTPLERAGHGIDRLLGAMPYVAPLARLGRLRSAGINDLRHGSIVAASADADRQPQVALPSDTRCFAIAGSLGPPEGSLKASALGDGLVPIDSALGRHRRAERRLSFPLDRQAIVHQANHLELLASAEVSNLLLRWLR